MGGGKIKKEQITAALGYTPVSLDEITRQINTAVNAAIGSAFRFVGYYGLGKDNPVDVPLQVGIYLFVCSQRGSWQTLNASIINLRLSAVDTLSCEVYKIAGSSDSDSIKITANEGKDGILIQNDLIASLGSFIYRLST